MGIFHKKQTLPPDQKLLFDEINNAIIKKSPKIKKCLSDTDISHLGDFLINLYLNLNFSSAALISANLYACCAHHSLRTND